YLRASPTTCLDRVRRRHRAGEDSIPLAYLQSLHERHEAWLIEGRFGPLPAPILVSCINNNHSTTLVLSFSVFDCEAPLPKLLVDYRARQSEVMCGVPITTDAESNDLS
ncbi:hypothetical protein X801_00276, partial [Opisthorchis viverrini]